MIASLLPENLVSASSNKSNYVTLEENVKGEKVSKVDLETESSDQLEVKITESAKQTEYATYLNGEFVDKTITFKNSDKMLFVDSDGNSKELDRKDFSTKINDGRTEVIDGNSINSKSISGEFNIAAYSPPPSYSLYQERYSSAWGEWGYLYGEASITRGPTTTIQFGAGTAVSTVLSLIGAIYTGGISAILQVLGATIVGSAIDTAISGSVHSRTTRFDLEVISQGELGLRTYTEEVDSQVTNNYTGAISWEELTTRGDTRTRNEIIDAGIYNVVIGAN